MSSSYSSCEFGCLCTAAFPEPAVFVLGVRMSHDNCISVNDVVFMTLIYARLHSAPTCKCPQQDTAMALKEPLAIGEGKGSVKNRGGRGGNKRKSRRWDGQVEAA